MGGGHDLWVEGKAEVFQWLLGEHVYRGPGQLIVVKGLDQSVFVYQPATSDVDYPRRRLHQTDLSSADEALCRICQWCVQGQVVARCQHHVELGYLHAQSSCTLRHQVRVETHHMHLQTQRALGDL